MRQNVTGATLAGAGLLGAATLAGLALYNRQAASRAERLHPPAGDILDVGGVAVHVLEDGNRDGDPVVLIHGNVVTLEDWVASGVVARLPGQRVVMFDRPGYGYTERPRDVVWNASAQAQLFRAACKLLDIRRPVVVGHSWGALVALAWALDAPETLGGVGLISGYYYPTARLDAALVAPAAAPVIGPILRNTISPPFARTSLPLTVRGMFSPLDVPEAAWHGIPWALASRPDQIRAIAEDGAALVGEADRLAHYGRPVTGPVAIIAGAEDRIVDHEAQSVRLSAALGLTDLALVPGAGHMVHHAAPDLVARAITRLAASR